MSEEKEVKTAAQEAVQEDNGAPEATVESVQLTLQDLQAIANVVDLASRRGAFQAQELSSVGAAYNKLTAFLSHVAATAESEEQKGDQKEDSE